MSIHSQRLELVVKGMDCAECAATVKQAITGMAGVQSVEVLLSSEKAIIQIDPQLVDATTIHQAITRAGYRVPSLERENQPNELANTFSKAALNLFGVVFGVVVLVVVAGEGLGLFESISSRIPAVLGYALVILAAYPTFKKVLYAALKRQIISHTLMSVGVVAALVIGQWVTAAIVVLFMRVGDYAERFTSEQGRRALKNLSAMTPQTAYVERQGELVKLAVAELRVGDVVVVRPGEQIAVDGVVIGGQATVNQAAITGESMPIEATVGTQVFAATIAQFGSLRVQAHQIGTDTTFGRIIRLVEEAEAHRGDVQRMADQFSGYFLPLVASIASLTFLIGRDPIATAAVLVVACSCSFALATPIAMLASIGAAAKTGLLIKGGKYIEALAKAEVVLLDKTGTLTLGKPQISDVIALDGVSKNELLRLAASVEYHSEHPLAEAVRDAARREKLGLYEAHSFRALPGLGVCAQIGEHQLSIGNQRFIGEASIDGASTLQAQGKTVLYVRQDERLIGVLGATDTLRPEVPLALEALRAQGIRQIVMLTGDHEVVARTMAASLKIDFRANLLPEDKIAIVKAYQTTGQQVVMVGDGVNDAPALAQADVGIAMGAAGTDVALDAAHIAIMREDWTLIPEALRIARRTMRVVKMNLAFTTLYNFFGLSLAALGILPPVLAAAAQSLPDLGILANSSRLLRYQRMDAPESVSQLQSASSVAECSCCVGENRQPEPIIIGIEQIS